MRTQNQPNRLQAQAMSGTGKKNVLQKMKSIPILNRARRYDWRVWTLVIALLISLFVTGGVYWFYGVPAPDSHWGSVFSSWVGGVALFLVVGIASAITSAARPEMESFDARARILFRKQSGKHIDYIVSRVHQLLEHYADTTYRKVRINEYDKLEGKFFVSVETEVSVRSYIDDVDSSYESRVKITEVTPPPSGRPSRLVYIRADDRSLQAGEDIIGNIDKPFGTTIRAGMPCLFKTNWELWITKETESSRYRPVRYSQLIGLEIENNLGEGTDIVVRFYEDDKVVNEVRIPSGEAANPKEFRDIPPGQQVFDFRIALA